MSANAILALALPEALSESQRLALITLLGDEDPAVYQAVRDKLISCGPPAIEWLRPHRLSSEPALRRRALEVIRYFGRQAADNEFLAFCLKHGEEFELEKGAWLLAQSQYPDINLEGYQAILDQHAAELRKRVDFGAPPKELLSTINDYLFQELKFTGNEKNYYDLENSYLNRVIDRRTGNPINLCLFYILLARRLRLPVVGIGLPGHFICRHQSPGAEIYVDVFNGGKFLTKADCVQYLIHGNYSLREDCLAPVSPRRMLLRICGNIHQIYLQMELNEETTRLQRYLIALAR